MADVLAVESMQVATSSVRHCAAYQKSEPSYRRHGPAATAVSSQRLFSTERKDWRGTHECHQSDMASPKDGVPVSNCSAC